MQHTIVSEEMATVKFEKVLASETCNSQGLAKRLKMYVEVDHFKNYIAATYKVILKDYNKRECSWKNNWTPTITEWDFTMIDLAVDKYNELRG